MLLSIFFISFFAKADLPLGFVSLSEVNKNIKIEMRYYTNWNFIGKPIIGYRANKCILTKPAAKALSNVQNYVEKLGYSLLVFDCYRPQRAVTEFVNWTKDLEDQKMKDIFYPNQPKDKLIENGYIASQSGHSRGSTIDLTLVKRGAKPPFYEEAIDCRKQKNITQTAQLDMGTLFDCFDVLANTDNPLLDELAVSNRKILKSAMEKYGFSNYSKEWWHYTFKNEPFKDSYFDFVVE